MPTGSDEELAQPSVIVDMPEVASAAGKKKVFIVVGVVAVIAVIAVVAYLFAGGFEEEKKPPPPPPPPADVTITIKVTPESAVVSVDGQRVTGNPPALTVAPDGAPHAVNAKADGYESLEKDVKFDATKMIELQLIEIVAPTGEGAGEAVALPVEPVVAPVEPTPPPKVAAPTKPAPKPVPKPAAKPVAKPAPAGKPTAPKPVDKSKTPGEKKGGFDTKNPYG
jgi:hypothetical protein